MQPGISIGQAALFASVLIYSGQALQAASPPQNVTQARQLWQAQQLSDYQYQLRQECFCMPEHLRPFHVIIKRGHPPKAQALEGEAPVAGSLKALARTIPQWFDYIENARKQGWHRVEASFHPTKGHPTRIDIDKHERLADDEVTFHLTQLETR